MTSEREECLFLERLSGKGPRSPRWRGFGASNPDTARNLPKHVHTPLVVSTNIVSLMKN